VLNSGVVCRVSFGLEVGRTRYVVVDEEVVHPGGGDVVLQPFEVHPMTPIAEYHFLLGEVVFFVGVARVFSVVHYSGFSVAYAQ